MYCYSSIDQLLEERKANPEEVLMNLGFGDTDQTVGARLPARFLASQTQASGINMPHFIMSHPELSRYLNPESNYGRTVDLIISIKSMGRVVR